MREKLIEILRKAESDDKLHWLDLYDLVDSADDFADYLLASGVIVLPCKVGQKIYVVGNNFDVWQIKECEAGEFVIDEQRTQVLVCFECDNDCEGCPFNSWAQGFSGEWSCDGEYGQELIDFDEFGKTVFLTREEAEAALKEGQR